MSFYPYGVAPGQAAIAVTGTAVQLPDNSGIPNGIIIIANPDNTDPITVGNSDVTEDADGTGNGAVLAPGAMISAVVYNTNVIWINGTSGDWVSFLAS